MRNQNQLRESVISYQTGEIIKPKLSLTKTQIPGFFKISLTYQEDIRVLEIDGVAERNVRYSFATNQANLSTEGFQRLSFDHIAFDHISEPILRLDATRNEL